MMAVLSIIFWKIDVQPCCPITPFFYNFYPATRQFSCAYYTIVDIV